VHTTAGTNLTVLVLPTPEAVRGARLHRVTVSFDRKGPAKAAVAVAHERLPDPDEAETAKVSSQARLTQLTSYLES
jgi:hypothetical protein